MEKKPGSCKKGEPFCFSHVFWVTQFLVCVATASSSSSWDGIVVTEADYQGLQAFKHDLVDPNGVLRSWNDTGYGACSGGWAGIKCSQGQVIVIQLPWRGLGGRITEKISQFQGLRKLSLHDNELVGSIPISIGLLPNLRGVQLYNNMLSGSIPASLGLCPLIQTIDLGNNSLSGELPATLVNSTRLFRLNVSYNSLSGSIPYSVTQSRSLIYLALERNNFSGAIPDSWGGDSFQLQYLTLDHNSFNGSIPVSFSNLKNLSILDLSYNRIEGQIPAEIGNISSLGKLDLSNNNLVGEIPVSIGELPNLYFFNVSYNNLSGSVPIILSQRFNASAFLGNLQLCGFSASAPCSPPPAPEKRHRRMGIKDILLIAFAVSLIILMVICCILIVCLMRKTKKEKEANKSGSAAVGEGASGKGEKGTQSTAREIQTSSDTGGKLVHFDGAIAFTADDLLCATAEIIGKSTYGTVYKATMEDGIQVAVKRLRERITKGQKDFEIEVNALGKIRHPHLLALRAYYLGPKGEKLLVFDYMVNGSLATFLHGIRMHKVSIFCAPKSLLLDQLVIFFFLGILQLEHLHNNVSIIHGNLTSTNILLDEHINAKISDYGLSRLMTASANANVIATAGALGYRAPELSKLKKATTKSDVYSLGVIMLELLTGKSPGEEMNGVDLPQWVASIVKEEWTKDVFDLELMRDSSVIGDELLNTLKLALHCVDPSPSARPEASQILQQLEEIRPDTAASSSGEDIAGGGAVSSSD